VAEFGLRQEFPPEVLAEADVARIGMPAARARAVRELAARVASGALRLAPERELAETVERLCALPGVGAWTAQYIAMRALREPDAFPEGDVALRRALAAGGGTRPSSAEVQARAEDVRFTEGGHRRPQPDDEKARAVEARAGTEVAVAGRAVRDGEAGRVEHRSGRRDPRAAHLRGATRAVLEEDDVVAAGEGRRPGRLLRPVTPNPADASS